MLVTTVKPPAARCYYSPRSIPERVFAAGVACASVAARRRRTSPAAMALTLARALAVHWLVRSAQLEWAHAPLSLAWDDAAAQLAQPESRFGRFAVGDDELSLHWLEVPSSTAESATRPLVHCNHGFGASALSWRPCMRGLADALGARVAVAHDAPAFGLTQRPRGSLGAYTLRANAALTTELVSRVGARAPNGGGARAPPGFAGHSMGAHSAIQAALDACDAPDAGPVLLVLVAPAILSITEKPERALAGSRAAGPRAAARPWARVARLVPERASAAAGRALARLASVPLRRLVFGRGFWERGLAMAWHAPRGRDDFERMARDYALPSRVRGWEDGMLRFVLARGREGIAAGSARLVSLARERIQQRRLRVLIVQGARDRILPPANALALRDALGGDTALVCGAEAAIVAGGDPLHFGDCGHVPHEEQPERFARAVRAWAAAGGS